MADDDIPILGKLKDKLVRQKEEIAREGRHLTGEHSTTGVPKPPDPAKLAPMILTPLVAFWLLAM